MINFFDKGAESNKSLRSSATLEYTELSSVDRRMREEGSDTKLKGKINNSRAEGGAFVLLPMILQNKSERDINKPWDFNIFLSRRNKMALEEIGYLVLRIGFRAVVRHLLEELNSHCVHAQQKNLAASV